MKKIVFAVLGMATFALVAGEATDKEDASALSPTERAARRDRIVMERHGGFVVAKGTPSGSIVVVNAQSKVGSEIFSISDSKVLKRFESVVKVVATESAPLAQVDALKKSYKADFALFVVDDPALPPSLVAVEAQWAIMNIAPLAATAVNERNLSIRAKNEFARVFAMLCGGCASQFKAPLTNNIIEIRDLDACTEELPVDVTSRINAYLLQRKITPEKKVLYRKACMEGWAPQPTNDYQKVVWEEVHAKPTNPMKIIFDPEKGE